MQDLLIFLNFILYIKISYFHAFKLVGGYTVLRNTSRTQNLFERKKGKFTVVKRERQKHEEILQYL